MPEKNISEIPRSWRELYEKGKAAMDRQNWDYAIAILNQILEKEPAFYDCREALRAVQLKKVAAGTSFFKKILGAAGSSPKLAKAQLALRSDPHEALKVAEEILNTDPNSVSAHKVLAEAALQADYPKTAVLSLEIAFRNSPTDKEIAYRLGDALAKIGQVARAESIFAELVKAYPTDQDLAQALKNYTAARTMTEGGYETIATGEGSYRDALKDKDEAVALEQEQRQVKSEDVAERLIQEYEARLHQEPQNMKLVRSIGELRVERKEFDQALELFGRIQSAEGGADASLEKIMAETKLKKYDHQIAQLNPEDPQTKEARAQLKAERDEFELLECKRLVDRYPNDLQLRFELGEVYFRAGKITEAIQELQKAQNNPHRRSAAMRLLGQCFGRRGMNDLAARTFQNAIKEKLVFDEEKKELIYLLACALEKMGKAAEAIDQFKLIYETDIGYRDVAAKVDAYYASAGNEG